MEHVIDKDELANYKAPSPAGSQVRDKIGLSYAKIAAKTYKGKERWTPNNEII